MKTIQEQIEVMQHFADGGEVECRTAREWFTAPNPSWNWSAYDYRIKQPVDPYAELKAAAADPTKQIRCRDAMGFSEWRDAGVHWNWNRQPCNYEIRDKPDPYAELKAAAADPTKQISVDGFVWHDAGTIDWDWSLPVDCYYIRDKPKPLKEVKLLAWFTGERLTWMSEDYSPLEQWKRVPMQDKVIEVEE